MSSNILQQNSGQFVASAPPYVNSLAALTLVSAASIGSNFVAVRKGEMSPALAIGNGIVKGLTATALLSQKPVTSSQAFIAAGALALSAYAIDSVMKSPSGKSSKKESEVVL